MSIFLAPGRRAMLVAGAVAFGLPAVAARAGTPPPDKGADFHPSWSPDGARIAFYGYRDGVPDIFVMNADGSDPANLTNSPARWEIEPHWSPDGATIAFGAGKDMGDLRPNRLAASGGPAQPLYPGAATEDVLSAWDPAGGRVLIGRRGVRDGLFVVDVIDGARTLLRANPNPAAGPWSVSPKPSPDGRRVAFVLTRPDRSTDVWVMNADGSGARALTADSVSREPAWSPDGHRLVFTTGRGNDVGLHVMNADGSNRRPLTNLQASALYWPAWSPDGRHIAFSATIGTDTRIWRVNPDGTGLLQLTR